MQALDLTSSHPHGPHETSRLLARIAARFEHREPSELLAWATDSFAPDIALATSFGPQTLVLMHMVARIRPETTVFYLDTDLLFDETYALRERLEQRLGLIITRVPASLTLDEQSERFGPSLWTRSPDRCCHLRKVLPLRKFLSTRRAWITGVRRRHTAERAAAQLVEWDDANGLVKVNPLVHWSGRQVWTYIREHDLPFNPLHRAGYTSIGCRPCTRPVLPGEDPRAGRWSGFEKRECGIHSGAVAGGTASAPRLIQLGDNPPREPGR